MQTYESLKHTTWECKYHVVFIPKCRRKVPNSDGLEIYAPPVKFGVLQLDQSYVIAGQFALQLQYGKLSGPDEQTKQQRQANFQRKLEWMDQYRLKQLKRFTTRTLD